MSVILSVFNDLCLTRPTCILDQHFGMGLSEADLLAPFTLPQNVRGLMGIPSFSYYRPWKSCDGQKDVGSEISQNKDKYQVNLDVQHFSPEEITVKITGDSIVTIEGKHEEKEDEHGYVSRQLVRKYVLPKGYDIQNIQSKLSSDGVLTIVALALNTPPIEDRRIPIQQIGVPSKPDENKFEDKKDEK